MYAEDGHLHIEKGFMNYNSFFKAYEAHENKPIAVHFRITTHGDTDEGNTHPFQVGPNLGFIHNGIISNVDCSEDKTRSDTYHFNSKFLSQFYKRDSRFIFKEHFKDIIRSYIGYSKLVFLNNKGHHTIVNEDKGLWDEGVWYSNTSYRPFVQKAQVLKVGNGGYVKPTTGKVSDTLSIGSRVSIKSPNLNGIGYIRYFHSNMMIGVYVPLLKEVVVLPPVFITPTSEENPFQVGDWVVKVGQSANDIYTVTGTAKHTCWIQPLNKNAIGEGVTELIDSGSLEEWSYLGV